MIEGTGSSGTVHFSDEAIDAVIAALPPDCCPRRLALLPKIVREWAHVDLRQQSDYHSAERRTAARKRTERLKVLGESAQNLVEAFAALDDDGLWEVAVWTECQRKHETLLRLNQSDIAEGLNRQNAAVEWLADLAVKFRDCANANAKGRGRPKELIPYLVMLDLEAIFEYATDIKAKRKFTILIIPTVAMNTVSSGIFYRLYGRSYLVQ